MVEINSYPELVNLINDKAKAYLPMFKKGSEQSDCAFINISERGKQAQGIKLFYADVSKTRDIHTRFNITTVPALLEFENGVYKNFIKGCSDVAYYNALFDDVIYLAENKNDEKPQKRVAVYSTPTCSWCNTLKSYLKLHKVRYADIDISRDQRAADELVKRSGEMGVPQTDINGEIIGGFNKARLNELLNIQG